MDTEFRNKLIIRCLVGTILGVFVGVLFWVAFSDPGYKAGLILHLVMSGVQGLIAFGGTIVYDIESWGLRKATLTHFSMTLIVFIVNSLWLGWFAGTAFVIALVIYIFVYAAIWISEMLYWKKTVKEMNEELEKFKKK